MKRITLRELNEQYGGVLPPDAVLRPDEESVPRTEPSPSRAHSPRKAKRGKANPVVAKILGYRRFFTAIEKLDPPLSPGSIALWCWLWTCERKGVARCTIRRVAKRFRFSVSTAQRRLDELKQAGFVRTVRKGKPNRSASLLRVRCSIKRQSVEKEIVPPVT